jgi:hypothetical protein
MPPVKQADPAAAELDAAFAEAMKGPARPREAPPPPEIDPEAPHGRDERGEPLAPHGHNKDGSVRKSAAGRRARDDQPRTGKVIPPGEQSKGKTRAMPEPADYTETLAELHDAIWFGLHGLSMIGPRLPVVGRKLEHDKLAAQAYVWRLNKPGLLRAARIGAAHNAAIAARCAQLADSDTTWVLMAGFCVMPFVAQSAAVFAGDEALARMNPDASVARLAELHRAEMDATMEQLKQQLAELAAQAVAGDEEAAAAAGAGA